MTKRKFVGPDAPVAEQSVRGYHHGNLRQTLIDAAIRLIETQGLEHVSVREVAKQAGVSPGAPFRHFPSRVALLTAVAEEAMDRLAAEIDIALMAVEGQNPLIRFHAIGRGFLRWAILNPAHFQVISTRAIIDFEGSTLRQRNDEIRARMTNLMHQAESEKLLGPGVPARHQLAARALVYGLARMHLDGQFGSWGLDPGAALETCEAILDQFMASITA